MRLKMYLTCKVANKYLNVCERERAVKRNKDGLIPSPTTLWIASVCERKPRYKKNTTQQTKSIFITLEKYTHIHTHAHTHARTHTHTHTHTYIHTYTSCALNRTTYNRSQINDFIWTIEHITCSCNTITTDFPSCYHERVMFVIYWRTS